MPAIVSTYHVGMYSGDREKGYFGTIDETSPGPYAVTCSSATLAYIDLPPGEYACFSPTGASGEHFRWVYLQMPDLSSKPTLAAAASLPAPVAGTSAQAQMVVTLPAGVKVDGRGIAPANALLIRLVVKASHRIAILYSAAGPVTLYCSRVG